MKGHRRRSSANDLALQPRWSLKGQNTHQLHKVQSIVARHSLSAQQMCSSSVASSITSRRLGRWGPGSACTVCCRGASDEEFRAADTAAVTRSCSAQYRVTRRVPCSVEPKGAASGYLQHARPNCLC